MTQPDKMPNKIYAGRPLGNAIFIMNEGNEGATRYLNAATLADDLARVSTELKQLSDADFDWSADCGGQLSYDEWVQHKAFGISEIIRRLRGSV